MSAPGGTRRHLALCAATATTMAFALVAVAGCDKLGLGKKDADGGSVSSGSGGGVLSFLGGAFEGEITVNVSGKSAGKGGPQTLVFGIKSPKVRLDLPSAASDNPMLAQGAGIIIDPPAKKAFMLMPAQKKAMVIDFEKMKAMRAQHPTTPGQPGGAASDPPKVEKTGKKEVIAGYECETWKVTSKTSRADMCVAEGIKWIDLGDLGLSAPEVALAAAGSDFNHFPLRVVGYDEKNVETMRMEATKIDKKKLDEARFVVPADFQIIDMGAMLGGLTGGKPGAPGLPPGLPPGFAAPKH